MLKSKSNFHLTVTDMADDSDLRDAVRQRLTESGTIKRVTAEIRAEVADIIAREERKRPADKTREHAEGSSVDNFLLNELILEYLQWNGYVGSASLLAVEADQPASEKFRPTRARLEAMVGVRCGPNAAEVPLLYSLLADVKKRKQ